MNAGEKSLRSLVRKWFDANFPGQIVEDGFRQWLFSPGGERSGNGAMMGARKRERRRLRLTQAGAG